MDLLGDFGGYNGSLLMICGFFVSFYSARMYLSSVADQLPFANKKFQKANKEKLTALKAKVLADEALDQEDVGLLSKSILSVKQGFKVSFFKTLCFMKLICRNDRDMRVQSKIQDTFEQCLDVRQLVDNYFKLNCLLKLLLTKQQQFLMLKNRSKAIFTGGDDGSSTANPENTMSNMWTNINESFDNTKEVKNEEKDFYEAAELLVQFRAQSNFDKRLLLGVIPATSEATANQIEERSAVTDSISIVPTQLSRQIMVSNPMVRTQNQ